jgi:hypothetical protein
MLKCSLKDHYVLLVLRHNLKVQLSLLSTVHCDVHLIMGKFVSISHVHKHIYIEIDKNLMLGDTRLYHAVLCDIRLCSAQT